MKTSETKIPAAAGNLVRYQTTGTKNTCPADKKTDESAKSPYSPIMEIIDTTNCRKNQVFYEKLWIISEVI